VSIKRCPDAVATGTLHDPYTNTRSRSTRRPDWRIGQIDHIVPLSYAWDMGAYGWPAAERLRFANDPANLLAVEGQANQDKGDSPPALWMPPNKAFGCQYAIQFIAVLRGSSCRGPAVHGLLRQAAATCPPAKPA